MTFAACVTETAGSPDVAVAGAFWATFGSLPGVAEPLDGVAEPLDAVDAALDGGRSAVARFGGTNAADGGTAPTDAVAEAEALAVDADGGAWLARLGVAAVDVTDGTSEGGATARGATDSTFVTGEGVVAVGDAGVTAVTTGAVTVGVTGGAAGATGSIACCVCCCV